MVNLHKPQNLTGELPPQGLCNTIKINSHCTDKAKFVLVHFHCAPSVWKIAKPEKMQKFCSDRWKCMQKGALAVNKRSSVGQRAVIGREMPLRSPIG